MAGFVHVSQSLSKSVLTIKYEYASGCRHGRIVLSVTPSRKSVISSTATF